MADIEVQQVAGLYWNEWPTLHWNGRRYSLEYALSAYIANLAQQHGVAYAKTGTSALAEVVTHLSGDDVKPDETEKPVIALCRANVINGQIMVTLLGRYFEKKRNDYQDRLEPNSPL